MWALNGEGRIAQIVEHRNHNGIGLYVGRSLDGEQWASACPHILGQYEQAYFNGVNGAS